MSAGTLNSFASTSVPPLPTPLKRRAVSASRREGGSLLTEPCLGQDTVYDGAYDRNSIATRCAPRGASKRDTMQAYSAAFNSKIPKPWNRPPSREQTLVPILGVSGGPLYYNPFGSQSLSDMGHSLSGSLIWANRGRSGPIGSAFNAPKRSPSFASDVPRKHYSASPNPGRYAINPRDDCFVLRSDYRKESAMGSRFRDSLQQRVEYGQMPLAPTRTGCNW